MRNRLVVAAIAAAACVAAVAGLAPSAARAAPPGDGPNVTIATPPSPSLGALVAHPLHPERLVLGYGISGPAQVRRSVDGGRTWSARVSLPRLRQRDSVGAPVLAFSGDGKVLYAAYVTVQEDKDTTEVTLLTRSTDGGRTWAPPTVIQRNDGWLTWSQAAALVVQPTRPHKLHLLIDTLGQSSHEFYSYLTLLTSTDGGKSWRATPACPLGDNYEFYNCIAGNLVVTPTGALLLNYRGYEDIQDYVDTARVVRSIDDGASFQVVREWSIDDDDPWEEAPNPGWGTGGMVVTPDGLATILYVRHSTTGAVQILSVQSAEPWYYDWGPPVPVVSVAPDTPIWGPRLAVAQCGGRSLLHAVWIEGQGDRHRLAYTRRLLTPDWRWTQPISLIRGTASWPIDPLLTGGVPFAAWLADGAIIGSAIDPGVDCTP